MEQVNDVRTKIESLVKRGCEGLVGECVIDSSDITNLEHFYNIYKQLVEKAEEYMHEDPILKNLIKIDNDNLKITIENERIFNFLHIIPLYENVIKFDTWYTLYSKNAELGKIKYSSEKWKIAQEQSISFEFDFMPNKPYECVKLNLVLPKEVNNK